MKESKNQLSLDITTGEDIYFRKPNERRLPQIGDKCYVLQEGEYHLSEVIKTTKCFFYAKIIEGKFKGMVSFPPGIKNEKFRPIEF